MTHSTTKPLLLSETEDGGIDTTTNKLDDILESLLDELSKIESSVYLAKTEALGQQINITATKFNSNMYSNLLLKHGNHTEDCSFYEELETGRIENIKDNCSCGWNNIKDQVTLNKTRA